MRARKRFGQNFLVDQAIVHRICGALALQRTDRLLEVGPGLGALTQVLYLEKPRQYMAVEIDRDLISTLQRAYPELQVQNEDVLRVALDELLSGGDWRVVGNLPYNISTPLLVRLFSHTALVRDMHFMLQREVGHRLAAAAGTKQWGRLSVLAQYHCQIELLFEVAPESFKPAPKVHSVFVRLMPHRNKLPLKDPTALDRVLRHSFSGRRKRLANALKSLPIRWDELTLPTDARPDQLSVREFVALANACDG